MAPGIEFVAGLLVGSVVGVLGTLATFRANIAVLTHQVTEQDKGLVKLSEKVDQLGKDLNGLGKKFRAGDA